MKPTRKSLQEFAALVTRSVGVGDVWLFTQNKSDEGRQNFRVTANGDAWNGDWDKLPKRDHHMIAHWKTQDGTLFLGNAVPGALGYKAASNEERYKLLMGAVKAYRIRLDDGRIPAFAELFTALGSTRGIGNIYSYFPSFEVDTKSRTSATEALSHQPKGPEVLGTMEQRLSWHRKNHGVFREAVRAQWQGQCAVFGHSCNGLLIASHIKPWRISSEQDRIKKENGLLLSAGLDALFDRGLISFDEDGKLIHSADLTADTARCFGVDKNLTLRMNCFTCNTPPEKMKKFLLEHRQQYGYLR